jgi:hypothetical protein
MMHRKDVGETDAINFVSKSPILIQKNEISGTNLILSENFYSQNTAPQGEDEDDWISCSRTKPIEHVIQSPLRPENISSFPIHLPKDSPPFKNSSQNMTSLNLNQSMSQTSTMSQIATLSQPSLPIMNETSTMSQSPTMNQLSNINNQQQRASPNMSQIPNMNQLSTINHLSTMNQFSDMNNQQQRVSILPITSPLPNMSQIPKMNHLSNVNQAPAMNQPSTINQTTKKDQISNFKPTSMNQLPTSSQLPIMKQIPTMNLILNENQPPTMKQPSTMSQKPNIGRLPIINQTSTVNPTISSTMSQVTNQPSNVNQTMTVSQTVKKNQIPTVKQIPNINPVVNRTNAHDFPLEKFLITAVPVEVSTLSRLLGLTQKGILTLEWIPFNIFFLRVKLHDYLSIMRCFFPRKKFSSDLQAEFENLFRSSKFGIDYVIRSSTIFIISDVILKALFQNHEKKFIHLTKLKHGIISTYQVMTLQQSKEEFLSIFFTGLENYSTQVLELLLKKSELSSSNHRSQWQGRIFQFGAFDSLPIGTPPIEMCKQQLLTSSLESNRIPVNEKEIVNDASPSTLHHFENSTFRENDENLNHLSSMDTTNCLSHQQSNII